MSDDKKLTLTPRTTLGVTKGVETGSVRQSFSHGRSKSVVVERKKKRVLTKGGKPEAAAPAAPAPTRTKSNTSANKMSNEEMERRTRVLEEANKQKAIDEERRKKEAAEAAAKEAAAKAAEEAASKDEESVAAVRAAEDAKAKASAAAEKKAAEEAEKKAAAELATKEKAESEAAKKAEMEARAVQLRKASEARAAESADANKSKKPKKKDVKKPVPEQKRGMRGDRNRGKLTINRALAGDEGGRQRSLAAIKRAQAKAKRQSLNDANQGPKKSREVILPEAITVAELANRMAEKSSAVIKALMNMGVMATINENLDLDTAELLIEEFGHTMKKVSAADVEIGMFGGEDDLADLKPRAPVITVMGHVDHGKTSLLDAIRKANVVSGEAGGITQHIGAYQVQMDGGEKLTFLDTPGHAAFTEMRARGASCTDIVVLVVAGDDGVMPQTIEAINHAKAAKVPLIIAINKMDREGANPDRVRQELLQHEVIVESFSGDVQEIELSALKGTGIDNLKEAIHLQSELLELKANPDRSAEGVVIEAKLDKGRGPVSTVLVQRGTLRIGDIFVAGAEWGKVRALINDQGKQVKEAGPSVPVEVLGGNATPSAGDDFAVVESEARAREICSYRQGQVKKKAAVASAAPKTLEGMFSQMKANEIQEFQVVVKADVQGSVEAITSALTKIGNDDIKCRVLHAAVGGITESDVTLANASGALIMGFNVRPNKQAREAAEANGVVVKYYAVIYDLIDEVKAAMAGQLGPEFQEKIIGSADIQDVFTAGKHGKAAGCLVTEGNIRNDCKARILRDSVIVYEGQIENLRRFKDDVKSVESGQECGLTFENFHDFKAGDELQVYVLNEVERKL